MNLAQKRGEILIPLCSAQSIFPPNKLKTMVQKKRDPKNTAIEHKRNNNNHHHHQQQQKDCNLLPGTAGRPKGMLYVSKD